MITRKFVRRLRGMAGDYMGLLLDFSNKME